MPSTVTGGLGFVADLDTLSFVKHRQAGERHVFYVTFAAEHPRLGLPEMKYAYRVEPAPDGGWRTFGGAGGAGTLSAGERDPDRNGVPVAPRHRLTAASRKARLDR